MRAIVLLAAIVSWTALAGPKLTPASLPAELSVRTGEWRGDTICDRNMLRCSSASSVRPATPNA